MKTQRHHMLRVDRQTGLGLLDVLIAIVVISVGLLGTVHLQATGLLSNKRAFQRSQATLLAYDIADRMRANTLSIDNYLTSFMPLMQATQQEGCNQTTSCSSAKMAENDLFEWKTAMAANLRGASGIVTLNGGVYTISVAWDDNIDGITDVNDPNFQVSFHL